jgi:ribosomal protein S27AE
MHTTQITLTGDDPDDEPGETATTERESSSSAKRMNLAPPEQRGGNGCCPWCLAATETFDHRDDGRVRCGHCDASIPVETDWYERGEKIVL